MRYLWYNLLLVLGSIASLFHWLLFWMRDALCIWPLQRVLKNYGVILRIGFIGFIGFIVFIWMVYVPAKFWPYPYFYDNQVKPLENR